MESREPLFFLRGSCVDGNMKIQPSLPWLFQTDEGRLCQVTEVEEGLGNFHAMMPATCRNNGIYTPVI